MSGINKVILIGHLGADPESRDINGTVATRFSLATSKTWNDKQGQKQEKTEWHNIKLWGKLAETAQTYLKKGHKVYLEGHLETQKWQDKTTGFDKYRTEVVLNGFSDTLQLLEKKDTQEVPVPQAARSPQVDSNHLTDRGSDGQSIPPVAKDDFEDNIPF